MRHRCATSNIAPPHQQQHPHRASAAINAFSNPNTNAATATATATAAAAIAALSHEVGPTPEPSPAFVDAFVGTVGSDRTASSSSCSAARAIRRPPIRRRRPAAGVISVERASSSEPVSTAFVSSSDSAQAPTNATLTPNAPPQEEDPGVYCYVACSPQRNDYLEQVITTRVYDVAIRSPLEKAPLLSSRVGGGATVLLKREDTQPGVFSFKIRGAYNMMSQPDLLEQIRVSGCIAASAGNHAQGVALSAERLGVNATIVMPKATPRIKVDAVERRRGVTVVLHGNNFDEAKAEASRRVSESSAVMIPPFDHPAIIAGQGTVAMEILNQYSGPINSVFIPVGGGGLIAGMAVYLKRLRPDIKIYGVESIEADAMAQSIRAGHRVTLPTVGTFADGTAVTEVGVETFRLCKDLIDGIIVVSNDEICAAIKDVFEETRNILEPAGALSVAGLKSFMKKDCSLSGPRDVINTTSVMSAGESYGTFNSNSESNVMIAVTSGANTNFDKLRYVSERAEMGAGREGIFAVTIPERPGAFRELIDVLGSYFVTEFNYRFNSADKEFAHVFVGLSMASRESRLEIVSALHSAGFQAHDLTDDDMAKLHLRHLVGGRPPQGGLRSRDSARREEMSELSSLVSTDVSAGCEERVFRYEFPERVGALRQFLGKLKFDWNISMFHYRNHGADVGRVLVGIAVPEEDEEDLAEFLTGMTELGFPAVEETNNVAYRMFLR